MKNVFLVIVGIMLLAPSALFFFNTNSDKFKKEENQENLIFNKKKPFELFDSYYKNNFAFRELLSKQYINFKLNCFKVSPLPDRIVIGKNGWFFLGDSYNNVFSESLGIIKQDELEIQEISSNLIEMNTFCDSIGVKFYFIIGPNTHTIYKEFLPIAPNNNYSKMDLLFKKIGKKHNFINVKPNLFENKKTHRLYHKTDSHWNEYGAFIGANCLLKNMKIDFPIIKVLDQNNYSIKKVNINQMDLAKMLKIHINEETYEFIENKKSDISIKNDTIEKTSYIYSSNKYKKLNGLVYRDSYSISLIPFLSQSFGEMTYISSRKFDKKEILKSKPDFVIYEIVERDLSKIGFK